MSTYDLEEQEQLAALKSWWKQFGHLVSSVLTLVLLAFSAWTGWNYYQGSQAAQAGVLYEQLQKAARVSDTKAARDAAGAILEGFPRTSYAGLAALLSARVHFQAGDLKTARAQLQWAVDNARGEGVKDAARLRLANVLLDEGALDEAGKLLVAKPAPGFEALFDIARGDVFVAQKKSVEARTAYKSALERSDKLDSSLRELVQLKLDALGEA